MRRYFAATCIFVVVLIFSMAFFERVPAYGLTDARMHVMKRRILRFASTHGSLPKSIEQLPLIEGYDNEVVDGWGRAILVRMEDDTVTLTSYGRDGVPGGAGEDKDMIGVFLVRNMAGAWADELCKWELDPYGRRWK